MTAEVNHRALEKIARNWGRRATVRSFDPQALIDTCTWDPDRPDYPPALVPFASHPTFAECPADQRQVVYTLAWYAYNERVITAEDRVANPAFALVQQGCFGIAASPALQDAVQQALIDEHWHTYIHRSAMRSSVGHRGVDASGWWPRSITYRTLLREQNAAVETWQKDLLTLIWTVVSEISINALLSALANDESVQPLHRAVTAMHAKDETAHSAVMAEVAKCLWIGFNREQKDRFAEALPVAMRAFAAQDDSAWRAIVQRAGLAGGAEMLDESLSDPSAPALVRDFTGVARLARDLGIADRIDFDSASTGAALVEA
jgi:4-aminobenzoate N-oxygenase